MRPIFFILLIFNFIFVPIKVHRGWENYIKSYDWLFNLGMRAEIDLTRLIIQTVIILLLIASTYTPAFKKFITTAKSYEKEGKELGYIAIYAFGVVVLVGSILIAIYPWVKNYLPL